MSHYLHVCPPAERRALQRSFRLLVEKCNLQTCWDDAEIRRVLVLETGRSDLLKQALADNMEWIKAWSNGTHCFCVKTFSVPGDDGLAMLVFDKVNLLALLAASDNPAKLSMAIGNAIIAVLGMNPHTVRPRGLFPFLPQLN